MSAHLAFQQLPVSWVTGGTVTAIASGKSWAVTPPAARDLIGAVAESLLGEAVMAA